MKIDSLKKLWKVRK